MGRLMLKILKISQAAGKDWQEELQIYLMMYRSTQHSTTLKTPAELMFGWNIRDKLPQISQPLETNEELMDHDKEMKEKGKEYADGRRGAKESGIKAGDVVLVQRHSKMNKLSTTFDPTEHRVIERRGAEVTIEADDTGKKYRRNVAHLRTFLGDNQIPAKRTRSKYKL